MKRWTSAAMVVCSIGIGSMGCASLDTGTVARRSAARLLHCDEESVEVEAVGAYRYRGEGCDRNVVVTCSSGALEPVCLASGDLEEAEDDEDSRVYEADDDEGDEETESVLTDEPDPEIERAIRAGLQARSEDIVACTGRPRVAIRAGYAPDGSVSFTAQGTLSGSPEERCVQDALDGVRVPATGTAGVVVHLVRTASTP